MTVLEIAMQKMQDLPQQRQQEVLDFIEFIALKSGSEFSDTISDNTEAEYSQVNFPESWPFSSDLEAILNNKFWQEIDS